MYPLDNCMRPCRPSNCIAELFVQQLGTEWPYQLPSSQLLSDILSTLKFRLLPHRYSPRADRSYAAYVRVDTNHISSKVADWIINTKPTYQLATWLARREMVTTAEQAGLHVQQHMKQMEQHMDQVWITSSLIEHNGRDGHVALLPAAAANAVKFTPPRRPC